ncbi:hypothetical protein Ahy_B04g069052 isoform A [Arachis hypogaea]|uniref:RanBP2-type domain-containing protein n=1 Tax=Arachis hypogaea TaxID=3818 RepID=A0A444ZBH1_ARAHY|nr:hypothetical protein Ahy_B04g069052 isoform A [Arachis hypogaea]
MNIKHRKHVFIVYDSEKLELEASVCQRNEEPIPNFGNLPLDFEPPASLISDSSNPVEWITGILQLPSVLGLMVLPLDPFCSRREDDWTCPSCGNVNFSFRTTCNMRNCTQPRPADHNSKSAAKPLQAPQGYSSSAPYLGSNTPSSIYLGVPPYGSSLFNGSSIPPYDVPFSGGSAYHYNYASRLSAGSPYRPLHLSGPTPYSSGSMMGNGGIYGMPPLLDRYGLGMPIGPGAMGPRPGFFPEDKAPKKGADATRDNDWTCPKCGNVNFSFRPVCNMRKCNTPKPGSQPSKSDKNSKQKMPEGSWKCDKCNNINYPFRTKCNRQNCGADKPAEAEKSTSPAPDQNDQVSYQWQKGYCSFLPVLSFHLVLVVCFKFIVR